MNLSIRPLTNQFHPAYLRFFDERAFSDGSPNGPCYCTSPSMDEASIRQMVSEFGSDTKGTLRRYTVDLLAADRIHGYLAFEGDEPIGWCNAGDLDLYANVGFGAEMTEFIKANACGKTMSVVCFAIAPGYRGKGIAAALLNRVITDAREKGFHAVEGYPQMSDGRSDLDYNGPIHLFRKLGFEEIAQKGNRLIMRKEL